MKSFIGGLVLICFWSWAYNLFIYFIKLFISFLIFHLIFNKFTYSENIVIRVLQKFIVYSICTYFSLYILICFDIIGTFYCDTTDDESYIENSNVDLQEENINHSSSSSSSSSRPLNTEVGGVSSQGNLNASSGSDKTTPSSSNMVEPTVDQRSGGDNTNSTESKSNYNDRKNKGTFEILTDAVVKMWDSVDSDGSAIGAGGAAASGALKALGKASLKTKTLTGGAVGLSTTIGTKAGLDIYNAVKDNVNIVESIKDNVIDHPYSDTNVDNIPSPGSSFINSPLELSTPIERILDSVLLLNSIEILLMLSIILLLFNKNKFYESKVINKLIKHIPIKYQNYINKYFNKAKEFNIKYVNTMLVINIILLILIKLVNLLVSYELHSNIDNYVLVYNHIKNNSLFILLSFNTSFKLSSNYNNNRFISTNNNNIEKYHSEDLLSIYKFGLNNPEIIKDNKKYLEFMDIMSRRQSGVQGKGNSIIKKQLLGGYEEVGVFKDILLLEENISIEEDDKNQDISLNEEFGIYNMLKYGPTEVFKIY